MKRIGIWMMFFDVFCAKVALAELQRLLGEQQGSMDSWWLRILREENGDITGISREYSRIRLR